MKTNKTVCVLAALPFLIMAACSIPPDDHIVADVTFVDHVEAGMIEQDVYIERPVGSGQVYRIGPEESAFYMAAPVTGTAEPVHHAPMDAAYNGPYPKGKDLGITLGNWLAGTGSAKVRCRAGEGHVIATFDNLVPNGLYTMWYFIMADPPTDPFSTYDLPVGARDGSDSVFQADADGHADYNVLFPNCLQGGGSQFSVGLAIAWHSDGKTYGYHPGTFGDHSHIQLFAMLPNNTELNAR